MSTTPELVFVIIGITNGNTAQYCTPVTDMSLNTILLITKQTTTILILDK